MVAREELSAAQMRSVLEQVVSSETLSKSERARELLTYIVGETIAGNAKQLKGFSIAVDVFGRNENFDPNNDALVRVHMGRVRELLNTYYETEGAGDEFVLLVPKGSYVPQFKRPDKVEKAREVAGGVIETPVKSATDTGVIAVGTSPAPVEDGRLDGESVVDVTVANRSRLSQLGSNVRSLTWRLNLILAALVCVVGLLTTTILFPNLFSGIRTASVQDAGLPDLSAEPLNPDGTQVLRTRAGIRGAELLPRLTFVHRGGQGQIDEAKDSFALQFRSALSKFETIQLVDNGPIFKTNAPSPVGRRYYSLIVYQTGAQPKTHRVELHHPASRQIVWTQLLDSRQFIASEENSGVEGLRPAMLSLVTSIAGINGLIPRHFSAEAGSNRLFDCLATVSHMGAGRDPADLEQSTICLERLVSSGVQLPLVHGHLGLQLYERATLGFDTISTGAESMQDAIETPLSTIRDGLQVSPQSGFLTGALGLMLYFQTGDNELSQQYNRQALRRAPYDIRNWADSAYLMILNGEYDKAATLLDAILPYALGSHEAWSYLNFLIALGKGEGDRLTYWSSRLGGISNPYYYSARILAAQSEGKLAVRDRLKERLGRNFPSFARNPGVYFDALHMNTDLHERFMDLARRAQLLEPAG